MTAEAQMREALLPCPFCGSADVETDFGSGYVNGDASKPLVTDGEIAKIIRRACAIPTINFAMKDGAIDWEAMANAQATSAERALLQQFEIRRK